MLSASDDPPPQGLLHDGERILTSHDAANFLDVRHAVMIFNLYKATDAQRYRAFEIPKRSGGVRQIHAPIGPTRAMQSRLAPALQDLYKAHPGAHGFIRQRSILTNAKQHAGQRLVLNIDLKDFFPSINFGRIRGLFMKPPFNLGPAAATVLAQLCVWRNGLPQGAPTSPILSNFIAVGLDRTLSRLARENGARYSRYADDITFSTNQTTFPPAIAEMHPGEGSALQVRPGEALERAITAQGFAINHAKVRLQNRHQRQTVTGLNVNDRPNVSRLRVRQVRAMLHAWEKFGLDAAGHEHFVKWRGLFKAPERAGRAFRNIVYGEIAFIKMVRGPEDPVLLNLCARLLKLDPNPSRFLREMVFGASDFDVFISHASEDKETVARPIFEACRRQGLKAFLDEAHIGWGQSFAEKINTALGSARTVLAIVSPISVDKEWPVIEVNTALSLEISGQKKVVPLIVGKPDLTRLPLITGKDSMFWNGDADAVARRLKQAVGGDAPRRPAPAGAPIVAASATAVPPIRKSAPVYIPAPASEVLRLPDLAPQPAKGGFFSWLFGAKPKR